MPKQRGDSNPGALDWKSDFLSLSYRTQQKDSCAKLKSEIFKK